MRFFVSPFFFSCEFTLGVWWIRILHRIYTRKSEHELLLLLGNVEYDYQSWRQRQRESHEQLNKRPTDEQGQNQIASKFEHQEAIQSLPSTSVAASSR